MNHNSFLKDFSYKFITPKAFLDYQEDFHLFLPLTKANRLTTIRSLSFGEAFFSCALKKIDTKNLIYKRAKTKKSITRNFFVHLYLKDPSFLEFILFYLPEFMVSGHFLGYILIYPFHHFTLKLAFTNNLTFGLYKNFPIIYQKLLYA